MHRTIDTTCVLIVSFLTSILIAAEARSAEAAPGTGSISGRVTSGGGPLAKIGVALQPAQLNGPPAGKKSTWHSETDEDGRFQFTGIPAGNYQITTLSFLYAQAGEQRSAIQGKQVTLNDGENIIDVNIALVRGGVVTGKITNPDGQAVIEQDVRFDRLDVQDNAFPVYSFMGTRLQTDDRGIYRAVGLAPGRYRVSAGDDDQTMARLFNRRQYPRTFHPSVQDPKQATVVEVREGIEITGVDVKLGLPPKVFTISGRAIDAETGEPVTNLTLLFNLTQPDGRIRGMSSININHPAGEFRIDNVGNGRYSITTSTSTNSTAGYSEAVIVEVQDVNVSGVEIRVKRGGSISGIAVIEGTTDPAVLSRLVQQRLYVSVRNENPALSSPSLYQLNIGPDGRFRMDGLRPGKVILNHITEPASRGINLTRIERDAVAQKGGIEMGPGEQVTGLRLVFVYGSGVVRGQVIVTGGTLPEGARFAIIPQLADGSQQNLFNVPTSSDARGYFILEGLAPGQCEIEARLIFMGPRPPNWGSRPMSIKQTVEVSNGQTVQVTMTLDLSRETTERER